MLTINFKFGYSLKSFEVNEGYTVLDVARKENIDIEGSCDGSLACSKCHVIVGEQWIDKLIPPSEDEKEMLGLLPDLKKNSRLCCQLKLTKNLDGIVIIIPKDE